MINKFYFLLICSFISTFFISSAIGQNVDADSILTEVQNKFRKIKEYEAEVKIKLDVDFIRIPVKYGTVWFMQPDKVEIKTKGFSLLPKRGMNFSPGYLFNGDFTALYIKESLIGSNAVHLIKVIPQNENDEIIIATLWIDIKRKIVRKLEATTRNEGTFVMNFEYATEIKIYDLPQSIVFQFDIRKNELPLGLTGDFETISVKDDAPKSSKGLITINYLKYIVNEGKATDVFNKKKYKN